MDGARAHFHPNVVQWLETNKIKYIPARHWPANSPDLFPMDYGIIGTFKNLCNRRTARTRTELVKVAKEVWSEIKIRTTHRTYSANATFTGLFVRMFSSAMRCLIWFQFDAKYRAKKALFGWRFYQFICLHCKLGKLSRRTMEP